MILEVLAQARQAFKHEVLQNFLVNKDSDHVAIVVKG
jgi:hypothetical protein